MYQKSFHLKALGRVLCVLCITTRLRTAQNPPSFPVGNSWDLGKQTAKRDSKHTIPAPYKEHPEELHSPFNERQGRQDILDT